MYLTNYSRNATNGFEYINLVFIGLDTVLITEYIILAVSVFHLSTITTVCRTIWLNDIFANLGIHILYLTYDILNFLKIELSFHILLVFKIVNDVLAYTVFYMMASNMIIIYRAFKSGFSHLTESKWKWISAIVIQWLMNILVGCSILLDTSILSINYTVIFTYILSTRVLWYLAVQILNFVALPGIVVLYAFIKIRKIALVVSGRQKTTMREFNAGLKLTYLIFRMYVIQLIMLILYGTTVWLTNLLQDTVYFSVLYIILVSTTILFHSLKLATYCFRRRTMQEVFGMICSCFKTLPKSEWLSSGCRDSSDTNLSRI